MRILVSLSDCVQVQGGFHNSCIDRLEIEGLSSEYSLVILEHFYSISNSNVIKVSRHHCTKQILYHPFAILSVSSGEMKLWPQQSFSPVIFSGKWPARKQPSFVLQAQGQQIIYQMHLLSQCRRKWRGKKGMKMNYKKKKKEEVDAEDMTFCFSLWHSFFFFFQRAYFYGVQW